MPDPLSTPRFRVRREVQDHNLRLVLESRELRRTRRAQRVRDLVVLATFLAALIVALGLVTR